MLVVQPFDGAPLAELAVDSAASLEAKLAAAAQLHSRRSGWLPRHERAAVLRRLAALVEGEHAALALLIAREGGKPLRDAEVEVTRAVHCIHLAVTELERMATGEVALGATPAARDRWAFSTPEPIGVVAAISAFNHPLNLVVHQVVPAIAAGCPVIVKPASTTPLTCLRFVELIHQAGLPAAWCATAILDDNALSERMAVDPRVAFLSFIGSARVGWHLRSRLPPGTRYALEHGGLAPVIVDRSADLALAVESLAKGGYYHAGQVCVSVQRIFVHNQVKAEFVERFVQRVNHLRVGDPTLADTEVGPLILAREADRVEQWVLEAQGSHGMVAAGGRRLGAGLYAPTVIVEPHAYSRVSTEEVFGPVTCVYGYADLAEAVHRANRSPYAFQAAVFANDLHCAFEAARTLDASAVMVNDHAAFRTDAMPFAGRRQSGYGIGGIPYTLRDMMQHKMVVVRQ
jgi:acyl-CoA reductase-like NAD-dependent aldehyde dehydrogenase